MPRLMLLLVLHQAWWGQSSVFLPMGRRHGLAVPQAKQLVAMKAASPEPHSSSTGQ